VRVYEALIIAKTGQRSNADLIALAHESSRSDHSETHQNEPANRMVEHWRASSIQPMDGGSSRSCIRETIAVLLLWSATLLGGLLVTPAVKIDQLNSQLAGQLVDFTHNHGQDNRIWSSRLCQKRDLYVYVPPCYDKTKRYPVIFWLHGAFGDETPFPINADLARLDRQMQAGCMPPTIIVAPDATIDGENGILARNSLYVNGVSGRFEDYFIQDIVPFVFKNFSCQTEPSSHALSGYSGGGLPAMTLGIKHRHLFGLVTVVSGPLNLRYSNCHDRYFEDFLPHTFQWAQDYQPCQNVSQYFCGLLKVPAKFFIHPVFGQGPTVIERVKKANPADLLHTYSLQNGELQIYIRYGGKDNFNFDAQIESFVHLARQRGIEMDVVCDPEEKHSSEYCTAAQIKAFGWLAQRLPSVQEETLAQQKETQPAIQPAEKKVVITDGTIRLPR
jgi:S-formylglutathione hydrolase FrmB